MKPKQNLILLIVLIVFAAVVLLVERPFENKAEKAREEAPLFFPGLPLDKVKKIEVKKPDNSLVTLKNQDNVWYVADKEDYPADAEVVKGVLEKVKNLKQINLASRKKEKHELLEVKEGKALGVKLSDAEGTPLVDLLIGKSGPDILSTYVRKAEADEVYLDEGMLRSDFDRGVNAWRDKTMCAFDAKEVKELKIVKKDETIALSKDTQGNWQIEQPISGLAENKEVEKVLDTLATLRAGDFAQEEEASAYGFEAPLFEVSAKLKDDRIKTVVIGNKKGEFQYFAKSDAKKYAYILYKSMVESLTPTVKTLQKVIVEPDKENTSEQKDQAPPAPAGDMPGAQMRR